MAGSRGNRYMEVSIGFWDRGDRLVLCRKFCIRDESKEWLTVRTVWFVEGGSELFDVYLYCYLGVGLWYLHPCEVSIYTTSDLSPTIPRRTCFRHIEAIFPNIRERARPSEHL